MLSNGPGKSQTLFLFFLRPTASHQSLRFTHLFLSLSWEDYKPDFLSLSSGPPPVHPSIRIEGYRFPLVGGWGGGPVINGEGGREGGGGRGGGGGLGRQGLG